MKISIALCTFNGGQFLAEQLASIRAQTRTPDELVLCDDASSDETLKIVERFARELPIFIRVVRVERNATTQGSTRNFCRAISQCTGDMIVLADQDDVWFPTKLAAIEESLHEQPRAAFCFSDAEIVDAELKPLGYRLWEALGIDRAEQAKFRNGRAFESLLRRYRVTGATMAFRSHYRHLVLPIPPSWVHDAWIALILAAVAPCELIKEPLIQYRQHTGQQHGGRKRSLFGEYRAAGTMTREMCEAVADRYSEAFERLSPLAAVPPERLNSLRQKIEHHRKRAEMRSAGTWRLPRIIGEVRRG